MKNPFRYLWEWFAYLQAFLDDTILYTVKKLQNQAEKETNPEKLKKIHKKILFYIWKWLSKSIWEWFAWFYEKYADLKKWKNLAQTTIEEDIPKMILKTRLLKTKIEVMWIKKWNIEDLKKLKDKIPVRKKLSIKSRQLREKMRYKKLKLKDR